MDLFFAIGSGCSAAMSLAWRDQCGGGKFLGETLLASGAFPKLGGYLSEGPHNQGSILEPILGSPILGNYHPWHKQLSMCSSRNGREGCSRSAAGAIPWKRPSGCLQRMAQHVPSFLMMPVLHNTMADHAGNFGPTVLNKLRNPGQQADVFHYVHHYLKGGL